MSLALGMLLESCVEEGALAGRRGYKVGEGDHQPQGSQEMVDNCEEVQWKNRKCVEKSL